MKYLWLTIVAAMSLTIRADAQTRPDFSGNWSMDRSRSQSAVQDEPIGPTTVVIAQTPTEMTMNVSRDGKSATVIYRFDGRPSAIPNGTATSRWDGNALVTETIRTIQGQSVTAKETRRLNAAGDEMTVDTVLVVQHGYTVAGAKNYGAATDIFVRTR